ncbi:Na+/H+ antiporter NhaC family protein [Pseudidiomarina andamanensis]|uniref:Sodium:proton antiporter n=1 Tax=Pseudidiomarina andamanensis TaxID=1940690 RepID=A0AA92EW37_9GAMM|nr:Na+/H+ antiporter NhaC family protein [Pseudidiomarina andamanensis]MDS0219050.1 sodium:proton antiporter [Pseudidiomarina andamanensis]QGT96400.1 sodium:proton antiporter [Pseudidiomarina andamanensis]
MSWMSVLPPLVAILVVFWRKEVIVALLLAIMTSELLLTVQSGESILLAFTATIERIVAVFGSASNTRILVFSLMVGALLAYIRESGGVAATVETLLARGLGKTKRSASLMTVFTGVFVFIESNLSVLTAGILSRGLFEKLGMSRARLAYLIDSTSAPVCILILLNGWGAYVLGMIEQQGLPGSSVSTLWATIPYNFYALVTLSIVFYTAFSGKVYGPMRTVEQQPQPHQDIPEHVPSDSKARYMLVPLAVMVFGMVAFMFGTGGGDITQGDGSKSVLYATALACVVAYIMLLVSRRNSHQQLVDIGFKGMSELLPLVSIVLLSLALGSSLRELGTGIFLANLVGDFLPLYLIAPMLFLTGALISFTTGTSWGTFAILIPIAAPMIIALDLPAPLLLAAVLGGGVFGDHCSPISDTTAVSALASGCDLLEHVRTQLPYALTAGAATLILYVIASLMMI